jgi:osmotically-inducible protein OsmY
MRPVIRSILAIVILTQLSACAALVVGGVAATGMAIHDRRSFGTVLDDNVLEVRIRDALFRQEAFDDQVRIKVNSHNGWVLLAGEVRDDERVALAEQTVQEIEGVRRLFNELSTNNRAGAGVASNDAWVSTRVNGSLTRIRDLPGFDATRVKVTTTRGIVYLMGMVSREEAEAVVAQARTVRGVERVVTLFEYLDESA